MAVITIGRTEIEGGTVFRVLASELLPQGWVDLESERVVIWLIRRPRVLAAASAARRSP